MMTYWIQTALLLLAAFIIGLVLGKLLRGIFCRPVKHIDYGRTVERDSTYREPNYGLPSVDQTRQPHLSVAAGGAALGAAELAAGAVKFDEPEADLGEFDLPDVDIDAELPTASIEVPDVDVTAPKLDMDVPDVDLDVRTPEVDLPESGFPGTKFSDFTMKEPEVDINMSSLDVDMPSASIDVPDVDVRTPDLDVDLPSASIDMPDVDVRTPDLDVDLPSASMDMPDIDVRTPDLDVDLPSASIDVPDVDIKAPDLDLDMDMDLPSASIDVPDVDVRIPDLDVDLPSASIDVPDVDIKTPDLDLEADLPDVDVPQSTPQIKLPTKPDIELSAPDFSVDTPEVGLDTLEVDLDTPDVDVPEHRVSGADADWPEVGVLSDDGELAGVVGGAAAVAVTGVAMTTGLPDDNTTGNQSGQSMVDLIRNEMNNGSAVRIKVLELDNCSCDELELAAENEITLMAGGKGKLSMIPCGVTASELVVVDGKRSSIDSGQIALFLDAKVVVCRQGEDYTFAKL